MKKIVTSGLILALLNSQKLSYPLKLPFLSNSNNWWDWQAAEAHSWMFHFQRVLWRLVDKTWMPLVFQASKVSSKAPHCQNYHCSSTKLSVITRAKLRNNEVPNFNWTLLHWTYLSQQRGWQTAVRVNRPPAQFYKIRLSTLRLSVLFFSNFFSGLFCLFTWKNSCFQGEHCRKLQICLCQIHIIGEIALFCQIFPLNIYRTGIIFHDSLNLKNLTQQ